jgi:ACS family D-galactonate transporter-like MFS transporter
MVTAQAGTELRERPERWLLAALLVLAMVICYAHRGALAVVAPFIRTQLGLSRADMGLALAAFFWSYSLLQMPAGWFVDRFGVRIGYVCGFVLWSVALLLTGFAESFAMLFGLRVLLGVGQASAFPASARAVSNWFKDRERGTVAASYLTGVRLGQALINAIGGLLLASYGFRPFFVLIAVVPLLWVVPWWSFLGKWERLEAKPPDSGAEGPVSLSFGQSLALFADRSVIGIFLGFFAYDYVWFVFTNWLPTYLVEDRHFSPGEMGFYASVPFVAMSVVIVLSGVASDALVRRGYPEIRVRKVLIAAGMLLCCAIIPASLVEDKMAAVWLLTLSLCGLGIATPNTWTLTQAVCSKRIVGTVSGIQNFGGNVGGSIAPWLTGFIADRTGSFALALSLCGGVLVFGVLSYWLLVSRRVER